MKHRAKRGTQRRQSGAGLGVPEIQGLICDPTGRGGSGEDGSSGQLPLTHADGRRPLLRAERRRLACQAGALSA
jgi:hypothetical protein